MMEKCLYVIRELKIESDILTLQNLQYADEQMKKFKQQELEQMQRDNPVLARIEEQKKDGDADSEALGRLQEQMEHELSGQIDKLRVELVKKMEGLDNTTNNKLNESSSKHSRQLISI